MKEKKRMSKKKKIILIVIAVLLLLIVWYFHTAIHGSLIVRGLTRIRTRRYVEETYPEGDYKITGCSYDFKIGFYFCNVQAEGSEDDYFMVWHSKEGMMDDREYRVEKRQNTLLRIAETLDAEVEAYLTNAYPHRTSLLYADIAENVTDEDVRKLELDMRVSAGNFPLPAQLVVWAETGKDKPDWEELREGLIELEKLVDEKYPCIEYFSLNLQMPYTKREDGSYEPEDYSSQISVFNVPKEVITGENLSAYLAEERAAQEEELRALESGGDKGD